MKTIQRLIKYKENLDSIYKRAQKEGKKNKTSAGYELLKSAAEKFGLKTPKYENNTGKYIRRKKDEKKM